MSGQLELLRGRQEDLLKAINRIENGAQEYRIGQRTVRRADLATLYAEYSRMEAEIERRTRPRSTVAILGRRR